MPINKQQPPRFKKTTVEEDTEDKTEVMLDLPAKPCTDYREYFTNNHFNNCSTLQL